MDTKTKIIQLVTQYKKLFPFEFLQFQEQMKQVRKQQSNDFSRLTGTEVVDRKILEYPENLFDILENKLNPQDIVWFSSKLGVRWFARTFPEFRVAKKI